MKTFIFNQKNGSGVLTISAENEIEAWKEVDEILIDVDGWRLTEIHDEEYQF